MIAIRLGWLLLEVIFMGFFCCFGSSAALGLAAALLLIPLCSLPINWYVRDGLQISLETKVNLRKGDTGEFSVRLTNPTIFPVLCIRCGIYIENQLNRNHQTLSVYTWILPKKEQILSIKTGSDYCGRLRISMPKTVLYDCFGICGIACKNDAVSHMTVQPDTFEIGITLIPGADSIEESDVYSEERSGMDLTETFQIREYVPGDSPRQIHWKLSLSLIHI